MIRKLAVTCTALVLAAPAGAQEESELKQLCQTKRRAAIEEAAKKAQVTGVEPTCQQLIKLSQEKCDKSPEDPGFKSPPQSGGTPEIVKSAAAANQRTADTYKEHGENCGRVRDQLGQQGACIAKFEELAAKAHDLAAKRAAAVGKPEHKDLERQWREAQDAVTATHDARSAAHQSAAISAECDRRFAESYQKATDDLIQNYLPLVAADDPLAGTRPTSGPNPEDPKAAGPTAEKRAQTAAARTAAAATAKEAGLGALAKKGFAGLTGVTCAKGDGVGCAVGVT